MAYHQQMAPDYEQLLDPHLWALFGMVMHFELYIGVMLDISEHAFLCRTAHSWSRMPISLIFYFMNFVRCALCVATGATASRQCAVCGIKNNLVIRRICDLTD